MPLQVVIAGKSADGIAHADAEHVAGAGTQQCGNEAQVAFAHESPGHSQQRFIRNGKADNAEGEQAEERHRAVIRDPRQQLLFHIIILPPTL